MSSNQPQEQSPERSQVQSKAPNALWLGCLGVVFGDIGTSPLYAMKESVRLAGGVDPMTILGLLSLFIWTLFIIVGIEYIVLALRADNNGEGGIIALISQLGVHKKRRPVIIVLGLFGAAMIYGDGAITPAISVVSAVEGLNTISPGLEDDIVLIAIVILLALFAIQPLGTHRISAAFGPITLVWFITLGILGIGGIVQNPMVLKALSPYYALAFIVDHNVATFMVLSGIFLCITGAEALYADMGHFGARPIRIAWSMVVFPALLLNYAGQAALALSGPVAEENYFYALCPPTLVIPLIILATTATVIASQALITGAFSITKQAIQLGWMPRMRIKQTNEHGAGQIYIGAINWTLMIATIAMVIAFRSSEKLAATYGVAVSITMVITTALLFVTMREVWKWPMSRALLAAGIFFAIDLSFLTSNMTKFFDGGIVPICIAALGYTIMHIWHKGVTALEKRLETKGVAAESFLTDLAEKQIPRPQGTAVFMTRSKVGVPPVVIWHVRQNRVLMRNVIAVHVETLPVPRVAPHNRVHLSQVGDGFWRVLIRYGFMEEFDIPATLQQAQQIAKESGNVIDVDDVIYYLGVETITRSQVREKQVLPGWILYPFAVMLRNGASITDYFRLPPARVVYIGRMIGL